MTNGVWGATHGRALVTVVCGLVGLLMVNAPASAAGEDDCVICVSSCPSEPDDFCTSHTGCGTFSTSCWTQTCLNKSYSVLCLSKQT